MLKNKKILTILLAIVMVLAIPTIVNAAEEDYTKTIMGNDGSITLNLTGLNNLDTTKQHEFALVISGGINDATWHLMTDKTETTATIELSSSTSDILSVLKAGNKGYLYIREKDNTAGYVLENKEIDLTLPYLNAVNVAGNVNDGYTVNTLYGYDNNGLQFCWEKITDETVIQKYINYKNNGTKIQASELKQEQPTAGFSSNWGFVASYGNSCTIYKYDLPTDGLYYLWIKSSNENCKTIYGYALHDGLPEATTVEEYLGTNKIGAKIKEIKARGGKLENTSSGWEYHVKTGDEVSVNIKFGEAIILNESPRLTVKFGTGSNIELTTNTVSSDTLTYKYTVKNEDKGALQVLDLKGGNVTNNNGTPVDLTLVAMTGDPVVAIESTTETVAVTSVSLNKTKLTLQEGKTETLTATVSPSNATNKAVTYKSSDETVAKVDANGKVTAIKVGTATITVTTVDGNKSATCTVTVEKVEAQQENTKKIFGTHQYQIIEQKMSWEEAKAYCESLGGYLVTITSAEEQEFIAGYIKEKGLTSQRFWMGATDAAKEGTWTWITGEKFSYTNWGNGQPNNGELGGQNYAVYVAINSSHSSYAEKWDDINEDSENDIMFICEWGEVKKEQDNSNAPVKLPNTGNTAFVIVGIVTLAVLSTIGFIKYKKFSKIV